MQRLTLLHFYLCITSTMQTVNVFKPFVCISGSGSVAEIERLSLAVLSVMLSVYTPAARHQLYTHIFLLLPIYQFFFLSFLLHHETIAIDRGTLLLLVGEKEPNAKTGHGRNQERKKEPHATTAAIRRGGHERCNVFAARHDGARVRRRVIHAFFALVVGVFVRFLTKFVDLVFALVILAVAVIGLARAVFHGMNTSAVRQLKARQVFKARFRHFIGRTAVFVRVQRQLDVAIVGTAGSDIVRDLVVARFIVQLATFAKLHKVKVVGIVRVLLFAIVAFKLIKKGGRIRFNAHHVVAIAFAAWMALGVTAVAHGAETVGHGTVLPAAIFRVLTLFTLQALYKDLFVVLQERIVFLIILIQTTPRCLRLTND
jgi:hypothetical protein